MQVVMDVLLSLHSLPLQTLILRNELLLVADAADRPASQRTGYAGYSPTGTLGGRLSPGGCPFRRGRGRTGNTVKAPSHGRRVSHSSRAGV